MNYLDVYKKCVEVLFKSGKKYFLSNHEIEFLLITNHDFIELNHFDYVKLIKVDYDIHNNWHGYLMKLLGIEFVPKEYDYIFSLDVDQIFVNEVVDSDILSHDFVAMKHWCNPTYSSILNEVTNFIDIDSQLFNKLLFDFIGNIKPYLKDKEFDYHLKCVSKPLSLDKIKDEVNSLVSRYN